ncbi:hypothetical protein [Streptococcus sp. CSL10205-OR2]|uniref:hypothetical protein n=1 Tax=Streptococcus sp. CSL10205-OR2 TaxID=2980558 RepID=UPI0021DA472C|nr:hypothetical protein [Streptococcus sp. CSL10205-OR2]MCU9534316.1 hypothetical protein [Streptococcus sp. CSL10205-OR2]
MNTKINEVTDILQNLENSLSYRKEIQLMNLVSAFRKNLNDSTLNNLTMKAELSKFLQQLSLERLSLATKYTPEESQYIDKLRELSNPEKDSVLNYIL